ncbi:hypothetical protein AAVH_07491 [Aphelenchoides avenae]|nr:hypothetical protein AAVH_07491 [Aphelenchus avenae]
MLRQSAVNYASIKFCALTERQCDALIRIGSTLYVHHLTLDNVDVRTVDNTTIPRVLDSLSGIHTLDVAGGRLPSTHVSDRLLGACVEKGIRILRLPWKKPCDAEVYAITQEALLRCCSAADSLNRLGWLEISHIVLRDDFFAKVVEVGTFTGHLNAAAYKPYRRLTSRGEIYEIPANFRIQVRMGDQSFDGFELRCGNDDSDPKFFFALGS